MKRALLVMLACITMAATAQQFTSPFEGTWRSGNFAFTFHSDGSYVYVGGMGNDAMNSHISEQGTWRIAGDRLLVTRASGVVWTSQNYRRDLPVETLCTIGSWVPESAFRSCAFAGDCGTAYILRS